MGEKLTPEIEELYKKESNSESELAEVGKERLELGRNIETLKNILLVLENGNEDKLKEILTE